MLPLLSVMEEAYNTVKKCEVCGNLTTKDVCDICDSQTRNHDVICVVETVADLWAIESTGSYNGLYHVLGGNLSASDGRAPCDLNIDSLLNRLKTNTVHEVVIATNATIEGQTTAFYIADLIKSTKVKITRPAFGIPFGGEFNYLDGSTLDVAFKNKKEF